MPPDLVAVCALESNFADDQNGLCGRCGRVIYFRPHTAARVPAEDRICPRCACVHYPNASVLVDPQTLAELALWDAKTGRPQ